MMKRLILALFLASTFIACKQDEEVDKVPTLEIIDVTPTTLEEFNTPVTVTLKYTDNNGDLGFSDPDMNSLEVKDARLSNPDFYHVPPLAPDGYELHIEGQLSVELNAPFLLGNGSQETTTFSIRIQDEEGNWSNLVETVAITIKDSI